MNSSGTAKWTDGTVPIIEPEFLTSLFAATSDLAFVVSDKGVIASVLVEQQSKDHARVSQWSGRPMRDFLTTESIPKFEDAIASMISSGAVKKLVELNHKDGDGWQYPVRYSFHRVGRGGSTLMLGTDLRIVAETQEQLVQAQIALERGYEERREHDARYRVLMANTRDAFVFVSSDGRIRDANPAAARLLDSDMDQLIGAPVAKEFKHRRKGEFVDTLLNTAMLDFESDVAVQTAKSGRELKISPSVFRAAGERFIICRLTPAGATRHSGERLSSDLDALFHKATDGIVICDTSGIVLEVNEAFLDLADVPSISEVKSHSLGEFLQRGQIDLSVMLENTLRSGHMRIYATRLVNEFGSRAGVEISSVYLNDREHPAVGFVIRDADRANAFRKSPSVENQSEPQNHNVVELVGSATLKEIVAETSDVIEKMCIETAVELTRNNRAAAAEMLGVSRQSLYVKLRKYGLTKRDED
jgi:transcriptional regulator PpsR